MSDQTTRRLCLFCDQPGKISGEDAWPLWLLRSIKVRHGHSGVEIDRNGSKHRDKLGQAIVCVVCKACNEGWMSQLEERVKPVLSPLLSGQFPACLDRKAQQTLAFWIQKTSMMLDHHMPARNRKFATHYFRDLFHEQSALPNTVVWIGKIARPMLHHNSTEHKGDLPGKLSANGAIVGAPIKFSFPKSTLRIEHLVVQSIYCATGDPEVVVTGIENPSRMQCIWPVTEDEVVLRNDGFAFDDRMHELLCQRDVAMNIAAETRSSDEMQN